MRPTKVLGVVKMQFLQQIWFFIHFKDAKQVWLQKKEDLWRGAEHQPHCTNSTLQNSDLQQFDTWEHDLSFNRGGFKYMLEFLFLNLIRVLTLTKPMST